ncbi:DMT family transporter [Sphingorhabdus sp.]|uniref:DMT family transporter n=1 Tax=Sphingorhabdus sp. TaxID=1902408 RepID=UPI003341DF4D
MSMIDAKTGEEPGFLTPRVWIPFMVTSLIWGSTWLVIRDQLGTVPATWSVAYRLTVAAVGMVILAIVMRQPLKIDRPMVGWTILLGMLQFGMNYNFVYTAEHYITSGLVAVVFALLIVPNAVLAKYWLRRPIGGAFILGSAIACVGVGLLMLQEYRAAPMSGSEILLGLLLVMCAVATASVANVLQVTPKIARYPTITILAWSMFWGSVANATFAFVMDGPPVIDMRPSYIGGLLYLSIIGSVVTFPLYFRLIHDIGPGKAAYTGVIIPVLAMLLSTIFEGYVWSTLALAGGALAMLGLVVAMQAPKPDR